ncbi:hypothetical protein [Bacillus toyonensis]|uniref:Uncharacterized protein n=1 Tax=Bacillus toyonensis TaxID=155322 RepID=A0A2B5Y0A0_9BACI|nr:hypothetical protein [Bacillus toyonensis]PGB02046.1 hypothetical protein COL93_13555 [Bacillus toyonensis]PHD63345.1 hypothetical protein COF40_25280 [Bacillus toyonensis]
MIINFHGNREQNDKDYKKFMYLVADIYQECIDSGYTRDGAAGKTKYELEPMAIEETSKIILYLELSYYFAEQDLKDSFEIVYQKLKNVTSLPISIRELPAKINVSDQYRSEIDVKVRKIIRYFEENIFNDDRDSA